jgi:formylglycine-generating enzyme required for sulfatase activity
LTTVMKVDFVRDVEEIFEQKGPLPEKSVNLLRLWISQGASWPKEEKLGPPQGSAPQSGLPSFREVQTILEQGGPLGDKSIETLRLWVEQGAPWPKDFKFAPPKGGLKEKQLAMVAEIRNKIIATSHERIEEDMKPYTNTISGTTVSYAMVPVRGGEFLMGSPDTNRNPDEGPQHKVKIEPFWMEQCEATWNEYELFMYPDETRLREAVLGVTNYPSDVADAVTHPTKPYVEMSFGMGKDGFPAISMTQHGANSYCQWLSAKTGHFYRLPTEAEWEYACRAGTTTAYSFGDDPAKLGEYAWFSNNSDFKYQKVGKKKPNPWGLYDMHGNVAEWTLDQYQSDFYETFHGVASEPWNKATTPYPHAVRGGSWQDDPDKLRSAVRLASDRTWKMQDPQLPKSIWYHTDAQFVGFRIIRPLKVPTADELYAYWHSGVEKD